MAFRLKPNDDCHLGDVGFRRTFTPEGGIPQPTKIGLPCDRARLDGSYCDVSVETVVPLRKLAMLVVGWVSPLEGEGVSPETQR